MTTFVGFGFGAIQAGLFLYEAQQTSAFERLVVAEVVPARVAAVRQAGGIYHVNVAHEDHIAQVAVGPVEIYNPAVPADRAALVEAVAAASEMATAIPSVDFYASDAPGSLHRILAAGSVLKVQQNGPQAVLYAAENHNDAAEILATAVAGELTEAERMTVGRYVAYLDTVIGKMSGVATVAGSEEAPGGRLAAITPAAEEAFLVEAFNRIQVARPNLPHLPDRKPYRRQLQVFAEKAKLRPFEEAKLYGHNALHAVAGFLGRRAGLTTMAELSAQPVILAAARQAAVAEAGAALCRRYGGLDPLFTPAGFAAYTDDLLARMVNPYLRDAILRVTRDPARKLGWHDRLVGAMRLTLAAGGRPSALAWGTAAAVRCLTEEAPALRGLPVAALLRNIWQPDQRLEPEAATVIEWIEQGLQEVDRIDA